MPASPPKPISGHVFKVERKRGPQWYAKFRLPDGRQVQKRIGPHWSDRHNAPPAGHFTKATARGWLDDTLAKARRGELPGQVKTGITVLAAFDDWLDYKRDRKIKLSTQSRRGAEALARLGQREAHRGEDDLVFCGAAGGHLAGHRLRDRYKSALKRAGLRELRFHDLRHTFGSHAIRTADSREVMEWMGHKDLATTQRYLQFKPRRDAARRISAAFRGDDPDQHRSRSIASASA